MGAHTEKKMLTAAEAEVMNIIWEQESVAVAEIVDRLPRTLAYTTVMTTVRILEEKGFAQKCGKRCRAFLYEAVVDREEAQGSMSHEVARRLFGGSIKSLMLNLVKDDAISADDLAEVRRIIESVKAAK